MSKYAKLIFFFFVFSLLTSLAYSMRLPYNCYKVVINGSSEYEGTITFEKMYSHGYDFYCTERIGRYDDTLNKFVVNNNTLNLSRKYVNSSNESMTEKISIMVNPESESECDDKYFLLELTNGTLTETGYNCESNSQSRIISNILLTSVYFFIIGAGPFILIAIALVWAIVVLTKKKKK